MSARFEATFFTAGQAPDASASMFFVNNAFKLGATAIETSFLFLRFVYMS
jgi:hypothetical protein